MALVLKDRVKETTTTTGTGTITLAGAVSGFQSFSVVGNANVTYYAIVGQSPSTEWEVGIGTYTSSGTTLSRTTVLESSNSGSLVTFSAGTKDVFVTYPGEYAVVSSNNFGTSGQVLTSNGANVAASWQAAGLTGFTAAESTTSPNNTVYVDSLTASAASTNADVALVAKGTGAFLAQVPDSTTTGGNKRGAYAIDFQKTRSAATQVASGDYSVITGGERNTASGVHTLVSNGYENLSSGNYSSIVGGYLCTASGIASFISGGYQNLANSNYAFIGGGASGSSKSIVGNTVFVANGQPISSPVGCAQSAILVLARVTSTATPIVLASDANGAGTTNQVILPNNSAYYVKGSIIANVTGGGNTKSWDFIATIKRGANAAATSIVGAVTLNVQAADAGASTWTVAITADTTNGGLAVTVTGQAATTIRWVCKLESTEVTF
jgi:hypothetical protein